MGKNERSNWIRNLHWSFCQNKLHEKKKEDFYKHFEYNFAFFTTWIIQYIYLSIYLSIYLILFISIYLSIYLYALSIYTYLVHSAGTLEYVYCWWVSLKKLIVRLQS